MKIIGDVFTRELFFAGEEIKNDTSLVNHSPDGFMWGYAGSGPAQAAFMILYTYFQKIQKLSPKKAEEETRKLYQDFKFAFIAKQDKDQDLVIDIDEISKWLM